MSDLDSVGEKSSNQRLMGVAYKEEHHNEIVKKSVESLKKKLAELEFQS